MSLNVNNRKTGKRDCLVKNLVREIKVTRAKNTNPKVLQINIKQILQARALYFDHNLLASELCTVYLTCKEKIALN